MGKSEMCGRLNLLTKATELATIFNAVCLFDWPPRYNIAPTQLVATLRSDAGERELVGLRWGLIPSWAKDESIGNRAINARGETIAEKPTFRQAFKKRRCIVLADGFYEWKKFGKKKQPYHFQFEDKSTIAFAGLWERWESEETTLETCTIVTTAANEWMKEYHDRMPVIVDKSILDQWLDPSVDRDKLHTIIGSYAARSEKQLIATPISELVNSPKNDGPEILQASEVIEPEQQQWLF